MKVAGLAEAHYIDLMPHNPLGPICTAATVHLAAGGYELRMVRNPRFSNRKSGHYDDDLFPVQHRLEGASIPGTGRSWLRG